MSYTLRFLSENRFGTFVRWLTPGEDGGLEATAVITLSHPDYHAPKPFYAKLYPDEGGRSRAMANEVAGYVLANRYGLPQPPKACICRIPLKKIDLKNAHKNHGWLKQAAKESVTFPAYCTEAISANTPWHHYGEHAKEAMQRDILKWPQHGRALAFDDIIANLDRHMNNLLRTGESSYALIDHGRLVVTDGHWKGSDLQADKHFDNRLLGMLYTDPATVANLMVSAAEEATSLLAGTAEVHHWVSHLIQDESDSKAFDKFIQARTICAPQRIAKRYCLC